MARAHTDESIKQMADNIRAATRKAKVSHTDPEVDLLWGTAENLNLDDGTTCYRRQNIEFWINNWTDLFDTERAETSLRWAEVKADIVLAVKQLKQPLRILFHLVCLQNLSDKEVMEKTKWKLSTINRYWWELKDGVCWVLQDTKMWSREEEVSAPIGSRDSWHCYWWEPGGDKAC